MQCGLRRGNRFQTQLIHLAVFLSLLASGPVIAQQQLAESRFGTQWPPLQQCLEHTVDTGGWGWKRAAPVFQTLDGKNQIKLGHPTVYFQRGGQFVMGWKESEEQINAFFRRKEKTKEHVVKLSGTWTLDYRPPTPAERTQLRIEKRQKVNAYFLTLVFANNKIPAEYAAYPLLKDAKSAGRISLVLNEFQPYKPSKRSEPRFTRPDRLIWLVLENTLGPLLLPVSAVKDGVMIMEHRE